MSFASLDGGIEKPGSVGSWLKLIDAALELTTECALQQSEFGGANILRLGKCCIPFPSNWLDFSHDERREYF